MRDTPEAMVIIGGYRQVERVLQTLDQKRSLYWSP
jgi:hypothetical protein